MRHDLSSADFFHDISAPPSCFYLILPHWVSPVSSNVPCPTLGRTFHAMCTLPRMLVPSQSLLPFLFLIQADSESAFPVLLRYDFLMGDSPEPSDQVRNFCHSLSSVYRSVHTPSPRFMFNLFISLFVFVHVFVGFSSLEHLFSEARILSALFIAIPRI